ncbi:acyl-CoA dehydrogenase family protein [Aliikangiella sp. IMCC44653]
MPQYTAPLEDIHFNLHTWLKVTQHYQNLKLDDAADETLINAIVEESGKFASEVLSPLNFPGDQVGCILEQGKVITPAGFKQAYQQYCEAGWSSLAASPEFGGQGLPYSLSVATAEFNAAANTSWSMYPGLTHGAIAALEHHATQALKEQFLPKLISGVWTGTMCLTEAHCGSDLGLLKTKAELVNGDYLISGTKIFISAGEHDMAENIIHLVLARLPDAPSGTAGISLFVVPKILQCENSCEQPSDNQVQCSAIEHKMGIKASSTCVINFDHSKGYLIGEPNKGLSYMFTMMNKARLGTAIQGYAIADLSRQASLAYAKDRLQMRSLSGPKYPNKPADPIIVHPDVRRMLLSQKALIEGCRGLALYTATLVDIVEHGNQQTEEAKNAESLLSLLTPICKAFMTEVGFESTNHAVQTLGGHGFICEWELEQQVRDSRITLIYEGTNGIQALDFLGRKVLRDNGAALGSWIKQIMAQTDAVSDEFSPQKQALVKLCKQWSQISQSIGLKAANNLEEIGAAAFDFLMYSAYISVAHILLQQANCVDKSNASDQFKLSKKQTMKFYFARLLSRTETHKLNIEAGIETLECAEFELN